MTDKILVDVTIEEDLKKIEEGLEALARICHGNSYAAGWWHDLDGNSYLNPDHPAHTMMFPVKMMLAVTEAAEAVEGDRTNSQDDKLPQFEMRTVEIADILIRLGDLAGAFKLPVAQAVTRKLAFNKVRPDHQVVNRRKPGGKKY